jgi:prophage regulatory protein
VSNIDRYLNVREVAQVTSISKSVIYTRIKDGKFPKATLLGTRTARWLESEIQHWIKAQHAANQ